MAVSLPLTSPAMLSISSATNVTSSVMVSSVRIRSLHLLDDQILNLDGVQVAGGAGPGALAEQAGADVVGELAALGPLAGVGLAAHPAAEQAAQEVLAAHPCGPLHRGRPFVQPLLHQVEGLPGHQGGPGVLDPYRLLGLLVLALDAPDRRSGVGFVGQAGSERRSSASVRPGLGDAPAGSAPCIFPSARCPGGNSRRFP